MRKPLRTVGIVLAVAATLLAAPVGAAADVQVLVRFDEGTARSAVAAVLADTGAVHTGSVWGTDVLVVRGAAPSAEALVASLERFPSVDYAEPDHILRVLALPDPNDPRFGEQYAHQRISSVAGWSTYPGSYTGTGGPTIAIVDTGIDTDHEDLAGRIDTSGSRCFLGLLCVLTGFEDDNGHGTHVAGIASATTNNSKGIAGVAYNTRIMALKVCDALGFCSTSAVASAMRYAADAGAKVVNMSLGGSGNSRTMQDAATYAYSKGVVLVAAAGNDGNDTISYPAGYAEVVSVAATDSSDNRASFSNTNADVELAAPGVSVLSTYSTGGYARLSGTSMASPHAAGLAALLAGQNTAWTPTQVRDRMASCSDDLGDSGRDDAYGHGRINVEKALGSC